jgi:hypothetical protein
MKASFAAVDLLILPRLSRETPTLGTVIGATTVRGIDIAGTLIGATKVRGCDIAGSLSGAANVRGSDVAGADSGFGFGREGSRGVRTFSVERGGLMWTVGTR